MIKMATGTSSSHQRLRPKDFTSLLTIRPNPKLLDCFTDTLFPFLEKSLMIRDQNILLKRYRDTVLPKLISGDLRITDEEKIIALKEIIRLFRAIKISLKSGNEALMQTQLKELFVDYGLGAMNYDDEGNENSGDYTSNNILRLIEMGDEGIDLLIKTFELGGFEKYK